MRKFIITFWIHLVDCAPFFSTGFIQTDGGLPTEREIRCRIETIEANGCGKAAVTALIEISPE